MVYWFSYWIKKQGVQDLNPGVATSNSKIGYFLLASRDRTEILVERRKSSKKPNLVFRSICSTVLTVSRL